MNNNKILPPKHGDSQMTQKENLLIFIEDNLGKKRYFYMTPKGRYLVCEYTKNTGLLPNKTEWIFLFEKTRKVSKLSKGLLSIVEELIPYIVQNPKKSWSIDEIRSSRNNLSSKKPIIMGNLPQFQKLFNLKFG